METWEMIKTLTKNPNYKAKRKYTRNKDGKDMYVQFENGVLRWNEGSPFWVSTTFSDDDWEIIQEPVDFLTAIKAYSEGKTIKCEYNDEETYYYTRGDENGRIMDDNSDCICAYEILNGKWYIEE